MVRITNDLIQRSAQYLNTVKEFQLDLRNFKITAIENLSATNDQFGCIDFTDNSIIKLDRLPKLNRLRTVLLINNRISKIEKDFAKDCIYLENLTLTNNKIFSIQEIDNLATCKSIIRLSLVDNLITKMRHYRSYVIYRMPNLRVLDFEKVKLKERVFAKQLFESEKGKALIEDMLNNKLNTNEEEYASGIKQLNQDEIKRKKLLEIIKSTDNLEEIKRIEKSLNSGNIDKDFFQNSNMNEESVYKQ